jgi:hypothetical protein
MELDKVLVLLRIWQNIMGKMGVIILGLKCISLYYL